MNLFLHVDYEKVYFRGGLVCNVLCGYRFLECTTLLVLSECLSISHIISMQLLYHGLIVYVRSGNCRQPVICIFWIQLLAEKQPQATFSLLRFSFSPFQYMMRQLYQIPVLHTKEGILTVSSICWKVSLHYWFYLSQTFNTIIFTVLLKFL